MNSSIYTDILSHREERIDTLALRLHSMQHSDAAFYLQQVEGWQRLHRKVGAWCAHERLHYPVRLSLEQSSGEVAALYKSRLVQRLGKHASMADLTGGLGVDFSFLAPLYARSMYVERNGSLVALAHHNFPLFHLEGDIVEGDAEEVLEGMSEVSLLFLDPARRDDAGRKTVFLEDCTPNVVELWGRLEEKAEYVLLKLSPMLDWHAAVRSLGCVEEVHIVAERGEVKDLLLLCKRGCEGVRPLIYAYDASLRGDMKEVEPFNAKRLKMWVEQHALARLQEGAYCWSDTLSYGLRTLHEHLFAFSLEEETNGEERYAKGIGAYLYDPSAALLKAGARKSVATYFGVEKIAHDTHLYTSDRLVKNFPGRVFKVLRTSSFSKKELKRFTSGTKRVHLLTRHFPQTTAQLSARLHVTEGGEEYWIATTLHNKERVIVAAECVER